MLSTAPSLVVLRIFCFIVVTISMLQVYGDESDIRVTVLNPTGFMAPGTSEDIILEIVNPIGSGVTILNASGYGFSPPPQRTNQNIRSPNLALRSRIAYSRRSDRCDASGSCLIEGQYPIAPGQAVRQIYFQALAPIDEPLGRELLWSNARLSIRTDTRQENTSYYLDTDIIRVVDANGDGDYGYFDRVELQHGKGGVIQASLSASYSYPQQVLAGENFTVDVSLTNEGSETLTITQGASPMFQDVDEGLVLDSIYRFIGCEQQCRRPIGTSPYLAPGDTMVLEVGTYIYQNEYLVNSDLFLDRLSLRVIDHLQRNDQVVVEHTPLQISIRSPNGAETINTAMQVPDSLPLEVRELIDIENTVLVFDPNTNREWLQLSAGEQFTLEEIESAMGNGGSLAGFRFGYADEVESLILNHVHSEGVQLQAETLYSFLEPDANESIAQLIQLLGSIPSVNSGPRTIGIVADSGPLSATRLASYMAIELSARDSEMILGSGDGIEKRQVSLDSSLYDYVGYWLVREL